MIKICVFDFDGTIADTIPFTLSIIKKYAFSDYNRNLDDKTISELRDKPIPEIFKALKISILKLPFIAAKIGNEINKEIANIQKIKSIDKALANLKKQGLILGIVSSNSSESIKKFLDQNKISVFDFIYTNSKVFGKASSLNKVLKNYKCSKDEVVYVGDEIRDIDAARKTGIKIISVTWGVNSKNKLLTYKPDYIVDLPLEIPKLLESKVTR